MEAYGISSPNPHRRRHFELAPQTLTDADISAHESMPAKPADKAETPGFLSSLASRANPINVVKGVGSAIAHPLDTLKNWRDQSQSLHDSAVDAAQRGDYREALDHGLSFLANLIPGLGKPADDFLTAARSGNDDEFKSKAGEFLGQALATGEAEGLAKAAGKVPEAARAVAEVATKPAIVKAAGTAVGAAVGHATGIPGAGTVGAVVGRDLGGSLADALAARKVPPIWDDIAQGTAGKKYLELTDEEKNKVQDLAAKMNAPKPSPIDQTQNPPTKVQDAPIEPPLASPVSAQPSPIRLVPRPQPKPVPVAAETTPALPAMPVQPKAAIPISETPPAVRAPTSDPNVVWDPERGHIDVRTGKAPVTEPDVVVLPKDTAQQIVDRLADPQRFYGKYSLKPNSASQIQRNADALREASKKPKKISDLMAELSERNG